MGARLGAKHMATHAIYALVGSDPFLQLEALRTIIASLGDVQRADFEGEKAQLHEVLDEVRSFSMFGPSKLVVVRDADEFLTRYREKLEDFVLALGAGKESVAGVLILRLSSLPANQRIHKAISKVGEVRKCEPPREAELPGWLIVRAKSVHRVEIDHAAALALAGLIGADLGRLDSELGKLAIHVSDGRATNRIGAADVAASVSFQREQEIKEITALLGRGKPEEAIRKWRQLIVSDPSAEFRAVTWLGMWLEKCRAALSLKERGIAPQQMSRTLWINDPGELKDFLVTAAKLGKSGVTAQLQRLTELDRRTKSGLGNAADNVERFMATALR